MLADSPPDVAQVRPSVLSGPPRPDRAFDRTFAPGTLLDTEAGWRPIETLRPGDMVRTLRGMIRVAGIGRQPPDRSRIQWHVPTGKLGNCSDLRLNAGQHVAFLNPLCRRLFDAPLVLVPVPTTTGFCGVHTVAGFALRCGVALHLEAEAIVFAQTGTLLHVPGPEGGTGQRILSYRESRGLLGLLCGGKCRDKEKPARVSAA